MNTALLETINRTCEASVFYGAPAQEVVSTGLPQLDAIMGGGIPLGRIVEVYGGEESGKTALALHMAQRLPGPILYVDADHGLSPYILQGAEDMYLLNVDTLETALDACFTAIVGGFGAIVIDTVTALPTNENMRIGINDRKCKIGENQAKVMSKALPILAPFLHKTGCTLILVNQMREKPSVMIGNPERPTGGKAVGYYSALRLETHRYETIKHANTTTGQKILVKVEKCKYAAPGKRAVVSLIYGEGVNMDG